jgi:hypothetical protein
MKKFNAKSASKNHLEEKGWKVADVERWIPGKAFITIDCFGFADLLACSPSRGIMLVQVTAGAGIGNFNKRIAQVKAEPNHLTWMASGGRVQVHNWLGVGKDRQLQVLELTIED